MFWRKRNQDARYFTEVDSSSRQKCFEKNNYGKMVKSPKITIFLPSLSILFSHSTEYNFEILRSCFILFIDYMKKYYSYQSFWISPPPFFFPIFQLSTIFHLNNSKESFFYLIELLHCNKTINWRKTSYWIEQYYKIVSSWGTHQILFWKVYIYFLGLI